MVITFTENTTIDEKLETLLNYYNVDPKPYIPPEDREILAIALNQPDVISVVVEPDTGAIEIVYDGNEWPKPPENEYE
jgi:hypothetical protein